MKTIFSLDFEQLSEADQYFALARGYLDGSSVLCRALLDDAYAEQYSHTRVILYLCRHAVELFLKGAILKASGQQAKKSHNIVTLLDEYECLLPDQQFRFKTPFDLSTLPPIERTQYTAELHAFTGRYNATHDQRYRYPADNNGNDFPGYLDSFIPAMFLSELQELSTELLRVEPLIPLAAFRS